MSQLARAISPVVRSWVRINYYLMCWSRKKYRRLRTGKMKDLGEPRLLETVQERSRRHPGRLSEPGEQKDLCAIAGDDGAALKYGSKAMGLAVTAVLADSSY